MILFVDALLFSIAAVLALIAATRGVSCCATARARACSTSSS
jgi:hypothetical protein